MAKCLKYGWYLPYSPPEYETGAWKRHYIGCVQTLDYVTSNVSSFEVCKASKREKFGCDLIINNQDHHHHIHFRARFHLPRVGLLDKFFSKASSPLRTF